MDPNRSRPSRWLFSTPAKPAERHSSGQVQALSLHVARDTTGNLDIVARSCEHHTKPRRRKSVRDRGEFSGGQRLRGFPGPGLITAIAPWKPTNTRSASRRSADDLEPRFEHHRDGADRVGDCLEEAWVSG